VVDGERFTEETDKGVHAGEDGERRGQRSHIGPRACSAHPHEERDKKGTCQRVIPAKDEVVAAAERLARLHQQPGADLLERSQHGRGVVQSIDECRRSRWHRDDPLDHLERVGDLNRHPVHAAGKRDGGERAKCPCRKTRTT
jgi:hypothetical protein